MSICEICGRISCARNFCEFCEFCGRIGRGWRGYGRNAIPSYSVSICEICGRTSEGGVSMAGMPYPPNLWASVKSVGEYSPPETSVGSANSVGGLQRAAWVWQDAIPSKSVSICEICGRKSSARSFCEFCEFRGRTLRSLTICEHL